MARTPINCEDFQSKFGHSPEEHLARIILAKLHPDPHRWDVHEANGYPDLAEQGRRGDEQGRDAARQYVAGTLPFEEILPIMGYMAHDIVHDCNPDLDLVHSMVTNP